MVVKATKVYLYVDINILRQCPIPIPALHTEHYKFGEMSRPGFNSIFASEINTYLDYKVSPGYLEKSFYRFYFC